MSVRQKLVTHISIAAMFSIGTFASLFSLLQRDSITHYVTPSARSIRMELIEIKAYPRTPSINSTVDIHVSN
jgi:hypothetical protein